ncbi:MAG: DNA topoisomerase VI subunit B, partial [Kiritimatiellia bacterium]
RIVLLGAEHPNIGPLVSQGDTSGTHWNLKSGEKPFHYLPPMAESRTVYETAESLARKQREISVSEFFLKNRHLLGFDNPRKALLTTVKEAVDNSLDACEEAGIVPTISVDIRQIGPQRFVVSVTDNGPGIVRAQIPKIFAKLLYGSKFHRLRMSRGQQGIGISAAGMYGQLTTASPTRIWSKTATSRHAHLLEVQIDATTNNPAILRDDKVEWEPEFSTIQADGSSGAPLRFPHGTCVSIELEATYTRGRLSVDEYLKQCAIVNPHLELYYRLTLAGEVSERGEDEEEEAREPSTATKEEGASSPALGEGTRVVFRRANEKLPPSPREIKPHPHGVELGMLIKMLRDTSARTLRAALVQDFSRVSDRTALEICQRAGLNPKTRPSRIAQKESEALFRAIAATRLMRPPTDCLAPIGEDQIVAGLRKEIEADFYTAVTRPPSVYRGNPFQVEAGLAYVRPGESGEMASEEPVRVLRFANRAPLLYMAGACAITRSVVAVNWKNYGLAQPRGSLPLGPVVILVHIASVWVPFTSESKEAIAHYPEIVREITYCLQECGRRLATYLKRRRRQAELERKRSYMALYIPHVALGLRQILGLNEKQEEAVAKALQQLLGRTHLEE